MAEQQKQLSFIEWQSEVLLLNMVLLVATIFNLMGFFYPDAKYFVMFIDFLILAFCILEFLRTKFIKLRKLVGI